MKKYCFIYISFLFLLFAFPVLSGLMSHREPAPPSVRLPSSEAKTFTIRYLDTKCNLVTETALEEYLVGVLAAEMPASYELDALKAQAVAARSYILSRCQKGNPDHPNAAVCTDSTHCKGWISEKDAKSRWSKTDKATNWDRLTTAVNETCGEYMIYEDEVVEAFFFASSGGRTENSEDVWSASLPYLRSVESLESNADPNISSSSTFTHKELISKIQPYFETPLPENIVPSISVIRRTEGGSVSELNICGKTFSGTEVRSLFGLKSSNFTVTVSDNTATFNVIGSGHGVGMSQSGANYMAKSGKKYTEILSHYYTNIQIVKM